MKTPWGLRDDVIVSASEVERGRDCGCICPACHAPLQAHQGDIKQPYFAHVAKESNCVAGYQTAIHLLAKEILNEKKQVHLPRLKVRVEEHLLKFGTIRIEKQIIPKGKLVQFDSVELECRTGSIIPDVLMRRGDKTLFVEIEVTHRIDSEKLARIREMNVSTLGFDLSHFDRMITRQDLKSELLFNKSKCAWWTFHVDAKAAQEAVNAEYIATYCKPPPSYVPPKDPQGTLFD